MVNDDQVEKPVPLSLLLIFMVLVMASFMFLVFPSIEDLDPYKPLSTEKNVGVNEVLEMGRQDLEHEDLIVQIRKDLKIPLGLEVKIIVGPYTNIVNEGQFVPTFNPFAIILMLNETFYQNLTPEEKIALISHELGHLTNEEVFLMNNPDTPIRSQIEADTYATKYASPEAMISVLNKANARHGNAPSRQYNLRIQNLEKIKQSRQAH